MSDTYFDIEYSDEELKRDPDDVKIPTYDKYYGEKMAEEHRKTYLKLYKEEPSKETLERIRTMFRYVGDE